MSTDPSPSPLDRAINLVTGMRQTAERLRTTLRDSVSERDRLKVHAGLRRREEGAQLIHQAEEAVKTAKNTLRQSRRDIENKMSQRMARLDAQYRDREGQIDDEAQRVEERASSKGASKEWMAESLYEGQVESAKKFLRVTMGQFAEIEELMDSLRSTIKGTWPEEEKIDSDDEPIEPTEIISELQLLLNRHEKPPLQWLLPWRGLRGMLRSPRYAKADIHRAMALHRNAQMLADEAGGRVEGIVQRAGDRRDAILDDAKGDIMPNLALNAQRKQRRFEKLESNYQDQAQAARDLHAEAVANLERESKKQSQDLEQQHQQAMDRLKQETTEQETRAEADQKATQVRLDKEWSEAEEFFKQEIEALRSFGEMSPLDWSDPRWKNWSPGDSPTFLAALGEADLDIAAIMDPLAAETSFNWDGPASITLPFTASLPHRVSTIYEYRSESRSTAIAAAGSFVLRLLTGIPPGKARLTLLDPVGLGESFAGFMHLADADEGRLVDRVFSEARDIELQLQALTEHMEEVIQKYLRNEYESIDDYNRHAGQIAEPYRLLVMADFPVNLNEQATIRLQSILRSGTRCGVYAILLRDLMRPLPPGMHESDLHQEMAVIRGDEGSWTLRDCEIDDLSLSIGEGMPEQLAISMLERIRDSATDTHRIEVPFKMVTPDPDQVWSGTSQNELRVSLGITGANRQQFLRLGQGTSQHALVAGKTGSGKSTLMHVLITNLALWLPPEEIEFYLVDFKKGVEFQVYATHQLPHARVIAIESDREFGLSVLQHVDEELKRRGELFRKEGVQDLAGYRTASGQPLPRVLLVVDEFQELFIEDDMVTQEASLLLDRLVRQGRAFGMHALLGSQTLDGVYSLARSTMGQMGVRIALQCSEADSYLILSEDNPAARTLTRPGDAIYNDAGGRVEGNNHFQVVWLNEDDRDSSLTLVNQRAASEGVGHAESQFIFRGHVPAKLADCESLQERLGKQPTEEATPIIWLGDAVAIQPPTCMSLARRTGANLLVLGQQEEAAAALFDSMVLALASQATPHADPTFVIFDGFGPTAGRLAKLAEDLPHASRCVLEAGLDEAMSDLHRELGRRLADPRAPHRPCYLVMTALHSWRALRRNEDDYSFSMDEGPPSADRILASILRDGPAVGMHVLTWIDTVNNLTRFMDRNAQREFENRVLFQMSQTDSSQVIDSTVAGKLGPNRALLHSEEQGRVEKFRPWGLVEEDWLLAQARRLAP